MTTNIFKNRLLGFLKWGFMDENFELCSCDETDLKAHCPLADIRSLTVQVETVCDNNFEERQKITIKVKCPHCKQERELFF